MFPFPNRDASVHRDWPADVRYVAAEDGARIFIIIIIISLTTPTTEEWALRWAHNITLTIHSQA